MTDSFRQFIEDESAAVAIEYALIAVIVSVAIYSSVATVAPQLNLILSNVSNGLKVNLAK